ncbi:MAG: helix-turn-helix domain-containing protein [Oscillospiraceae bacterium]|nr:helix-turn-helix domain-containing protein [Oscillospiraceae bacterium]
MKAINIARSIIHRRKEKGITQEELANHIGVSSASVSKWETGQSYPDIVLLPQLAAYFNISIDELMGYEPQLTKAEIGKLYRKLYEGLSDQPFDEVIAECREAIKKYFSCFPLLLQMGDLLINASAIHGDDDIFWDLVAEAKTLFVRVKTESDDVELVNTALYMEAMCAMILGNPDEVIALLEKTVVHAQPPESLIATAYCMLEKHKEAETILQVGIYQNILSAFDLLSTYIVCVDHDTERFDELVKRTIALVEAFNIKELRPEQIGFYWAAAVRYAAAQKTEQALDLLEQYTEIVTGDLFGQPKGDWFFNRIDAWLGEPVIETPLTPHKIVKESLAEGILDNPDLSVLRDTPRFRAIVKRLEEM